MNVIIEKDKFNTNKILFLDPVKNTIMNNGVFYRILYSEEFFSLNSLYFILDLKIKNVDKYFNKFKYYFNYEQNKSEIIIFENIEQQLLESIKSKKRKVFKIKELLQNTFIKIYNNSNEINYKNILLLKISGVWETNDEVGITLKVILI